MTYDDFLACLCLYREIRGGSPQQIIAVAWVLWNRAHDPQKRWPATIAEVVLQPMQFSSFNRGNPEALLFPTRKTPTDYLAFLECQRAWQEVSEWPPHPLPPVDPTGGCNSYWDDSIAAPAWAQGKAVLKIGRLNFVKL